MAHETVIRAHSEEITSLFNEVFQEFMRARSLHRQFNSAHEGYAVILEELDELWEQVKKQRDFHDRTGMRKEAIQVAAMAIRYVFDLGL